MATSLTEPSLQSPRQELPGEGSRTLNLEVGFFTQVPASRPRSTCIEYPEGGRNDFVHQLPSRSKQGNITLKRGVTSEKALLQWFQKTVVEASPRDLSITLCDSAGKPIQTWSFRNAYPVKWTGSDLNAGGTEFLTESLEIAHNGMQVQ